MSDAATLADTVAANLQAVRSRIERAALGAGRSPTDIRLVAVSKTFGPECIRAAAAAGQLDFGENKVQEALAKMPALADLPLRWHLIGHLQSNKARKAVGPFALVHSVDGLELLRRLDRIAAETGRRIEVLVQLDLAGEVTKFGLPPEELDSVLDAARDLEHARVRGLMLLPPWFDDSEQTRPFFRRLREIRDRQLDRGVPSDLLRDLSMGMSHDFEVAIAEGATIVRVGTAIFGRRAPAP